MSATEKIYDVIIAGLGPAGASAAIYTARKNLSTLIVAYDSGGQLTKTFDVENYLGIIHSTGWEMAMLFEEHVRKYAVDIELGAAVEKIEDHGDTKTFVTTDGKRYTGKAAIIATGAKPKKINVAGEDEYNGKGLTYCTTCDGPLYRKKVVTIIGGGTSGVEAALEMAKIASEVNLIVRSQLRGEPILMDRLAELPVNVYDNYIPDEIIGDGQYLTAIRIKEKNSGVTKEIATDGVFVEIGRSPNFALVDNLLEINEMGEIIVNSLNETNVAGIFAAGDVTNVKYKQIGIAVGEGSKAALRLTEYLTRRGGKA